ncbi:condensin complex subunit 3-like isoform X1 [Drosophila innubila]|uniref:condensin complex subunit 3-like isoform X1 n=1 Tax=Drosophila innubila TaxID=198719 RepID=UPI00148C17B0|nr:condensin complex subunit 3-like isoform X1 [Drosophila innubila]
MAKPKATTRRKRNKKATEKENGELQTIDGTATANNNNGAERTVGQGPMYTILSNAQLNETFHKRYIKELKLLYSKLDHDAFMVTFIKMFKTVLEADENNEYGNTALAYCAKFVTSFESERTHPILAGMFSWLLSTISNSPHIRYRICFSVNLILKHLGPYAALDDSQCDQILHYMLDRLKDVSPSVRKEAVLAMQRLQMPDNPNDPVICAYRYHLSSDPSSSVRQCVISCMGRNHLTVPHILQRLWDVDEKVRRHTYINMCNYPVRSYKVSQRLMLIERGLNDSSDIVRKNVIKYMLKAWVESYQQNYIQLTAALKLDSNEEEILRFRRVARQMLLVIFEKVDNQELIAQLPLSADCELHRCVPHEELTVELLLYWQCLSSYLQQTIADEFELILPELSVFCDYVKKFCQFQKPEMDNFAQIEFQCMLLSLVEILQTYDLGDEVGRENLKELISHLLKECLLDHKIVCVLVRCMEQLVSDVSARLQYFIEIIYEICELNAKQNDLVHDRSLIEKLGDVDTSLVTQLNSLKVKILELEELEENFVRQKEYIRAQAVNDEKIAVSDEYRELIQPQLEKHGVLELHASPKLSKQERVLKGLYISYHIVASEHVSSLNPTICKLYKDFICRHLASTELDIFEWAIKCGTTFSMLYEAYTKEVFHVLYDQFYTDNNLSLCETAAKCIFELIDHYGIDYFMDLNQSVTGPGQASKSKRRMLYTMQDFYDGEEDRSQSQSSDKNTDIIAVMGFFVEKVVDKGILLAIVTGLCRLVLRGQLDNRPDVLEKLLKRYFNPNTEPIVSQVLGMFFESIVDQKLQSILEPCLLPIVWSIMNSSYDSPLHDVAPGHVIKFFVDLTALGKSTPENNIHNQIAISFLQYIQNYYTERKEMCRLLAKDLTTLKLNVINCTQLKDEMLELADNLINSELEPRLIRSIVDFKDMLNGSFNPIPERNTEGHDSDVDGEECESVTAPTASTSEPAAPASIVPTILINKDTGEVSRVPSSPSPAVAPEVATVPTENVAPVLTTYGTNNQVGIRYLRRSLHNSISQSDGDSICGSQSPARESEIATRSQSEVSELSRRNLRREKTIQQLEQAMAHASKTPEKRAATPKVVETDENTTIVDVNRTSTAEESQHNNDSEVIEDSPTSSTTSRSTMHSGTNLRVRLRRTHKNNNNNNKSTAATAEATSTTRISPSAGSKQRKVLHLEMTTPLRNRRKRVLRKSLRSQSSESGTSLQRISPLRKQQRLDAKKPTRQSSAAAATAAADEKIHSSPTGSTTSSVKENTMPATADATHKTPQSRRRSASHSNSTPASRVTTRQSARKQRINAMCMTRKRMSLELSLSEGHLKMPTPKRVRQDKTHRKTANNTSSPRNARTTTRETQATTTAVASPSPSISASTSSTSALTRTRRK